jgi:Ca2+/Na+ antiporter
MTISTRHLWQDRSFFGAVRFVLVDRFLQWDAWSYVAISTKGYETMEGTAFFPGYPLLMKAVSWVLHISPLAAGVLISNVAFFVLLYFFVRLARLDHDWLQTRRAVLLLAFFPTAFFFSGAYTEAVFMLVSVLALLGMRKRQWARAGLFGAVAGALRNTGALLGLAYLVEYWTTWRERKKTPEPAADDHLEQEPPSGPPAADRADLWPVLWVFLVGVGLAGYMVYLWVAKGDPLAFAHQQTYFGRVQGTPWGSLYHGYEFVFKWLQKAQWPPSWADIYFGTTLFFPALLLVVLATSFRKIRWSYWLIILYSFVVPLLAPVRSSETNVVDYFTSYSRYCLVIVPLYFGMSRLLKNRWFFWGYLAFSAAFLALYTYAWGQHWWVA